MVGIDCTALKPAALKREVANDRRMLYLRASPLRRIKRADRHVACIGPIVYLTQHCRMSQRLSIGTRVALRWASVNWRSIRIRSSRRPARRSCCSFVAHAGDRSSADKGGSRIDGHGDAFKKSDALTRYALIDPLLRALDCTVSAPRLS